MVLPRGRLLGTEHGRGADKHRSRKDDCAKQLTMPDGRNREFRSRLALAFEANPRFLNLTGGMLAQWHPIRLAKAARLSKYFAWGSFRTSAKHCARTVGLAHAAVFAAPWVSWTLSVPDGQVLQQIDHSQAGFE